MRATKGSVGFPGGLRRIVTSKVIGATIVALAVVALLGVYNKERIATTLSSGETVTAKFDRMYKLTGYRSEVKLAGVVVGKVTSEEYDPEEKVSTVTMKIDSDIEDKLGTQPSAHIRPKLLLGGAYYVDLVPGGERGEYGGEAIPVNRTSIPVELDRMLSPIDEDDARAGVRASIGKVDGVLRKGGTKALRRLFEDAADTLEPTGNVLGAARGTNPDKDLARMVGGFESAADALTKTKGRVAAISESLSDTAGTFADSSGALRNATATGPETLRVTRAGLEDLQPTLRKLTETASEFRPSAQALDTLLAELGPVLDRSTSLVRELRPLAAELRPAAEDLAPTARKATTMFGHFSGPVLDRVNGPIKDEVFSGFTGKGPFENGGENGHKFYKEIAYMVSHLNHTFSVWDRNGAAARLTAGIGGNSLGGSAFPPSLEQLGEDLGFFEQRGPRGGDPFEAPFDPPFPDPLVPPDDDPEASGKPSGEPRTNGEEGGS